MRSATSKRPAAASPPPRPASPPTSPSSNSCIAPPPRSRLTSARMTPRASDPPPDPTPNQHQDGHLPSISVVVPVRNGAFMIDDCISSILACDYPQDRFEVCVVDNGSTDATA